jgi:hypothetical protein
MRHCPRRLYYYAVKPKGWDTRAVRVESAKAEGIGQVGKRTNGAFTVNAIGTSFTIDLRNTTGADISMPTSLRIMETTKGTGALHESSRKLSKDYFLLPWNMTAALQTHSSQAALDTLIRCPLQIGGHLMT